MCARTFVSSSMPVYVWTRLEPGTDPLHEIAKLVEELGVDSGSIVQCIGSLERATYIYVEATAGGGWRFVDTVTVEGPMEFVSAQGTWGRDGATGEVFVHMHGLLVDGQGRVLGGHFVHGSRVMATCEVALLTGPGVAIRRTHDPVAGVSVAMAMPEHI